MNQIRFIPYCTNTGSLNMALDETLLESLDEYKFIIRLYNFSPPCVSFGYGQKIDNKLLESLHNLNLDTVKRPTGGRAVLHCGNITYCFLGVSDDQTLSNSVIKSYKQISQGIIDIFQKQKIDLNPIEKDISFAKSQDCFMHLSKADLQFGGKKIVGSAQLRRKNRVLQHGSINIFNSVILSDIVDNDNLITHNARDILSDLNAKVMSQLYNQQIKQIEQEFCDSYHNLFKLPIVIKDISHSELDKAKSISQKFELSLNYIHD